MSARADRVARRDLRRAVGPEALKVIEQHDAALANQAQAITVVVPEVTKLTRRVQTLGSEALALRERIDALEQQHRAASDAWSSFYGGSIWTRLRWLVRGR